MNRINSMGLMEMARRIGESDDELRKRIYGVQHFNKLRTLLMLLRVHRNSVISIDWTKV